MRRGTLSRSGAARRMVRSVRAGASKLRPLIERRRAGRIKGASLNCNRGTVIDLSSTGMRMRSARRFKGELSVDLWTPNRRLTVRAEVVWSTRAGFRKYDHGLEFRNLNEEIAQQLNHFAAFLRCG